MSKPLADFEYVGNLHIHSLLSDGGAAVAAIAEAAFRAGLDFVGLNDHAHMSRTLALAQEGFRCGVLVLVGSEIGRRHHHYLAYDVKDRVRDSDARPQEVIDRVNEQGGFGFLAHPFEKGMPFLERSVAYTWDDLSVEGFAGICIWNFTSRWKERVKSVAHGLFCLAFKAGSLKGPSSETLAFWDTLCRTRKMVAIGGSDAHGSFLRWGPLRFTPLTYDRLLNTINAHVLLDAPLPGDFREAKQAIYEAMRLGRLFVAHDGLRPAKGFRFSFHSKEIDLPMGEEGEFRGGGDFHIRLPRQGEIRLIRDGFRCAVWRGHEAVVPVKQEGVYRVEAWIKVPFFGWRP